AVASIQEVGRSALSSGIASPPPHLLAGNRFLSRRQEAYPSGLIRSNEPSTRECARQANAKRLLKRLRSSSRTLGASQCSWRSRRSSIITCHSIFLMVPVLAL